MSDQANPAASTAAREVRSITARSKLIFGAARNASPSRSIPRSTCASSSAFCTASSAAGACSSISRRPASARKQNIPAFQRQPAAISSAASAASGFSTNRATACPPDAIGSPRAM